MPKYDPTAFLELVEAHHITRTALAPTMASFVLSHPALDRHDVSSVRVLSYGGMPMPVPTAVELSARFGDLSTGFGQTESTLLVTSLDPADHGRALRGEEHLLESCGRPFALAALAILDDCSEPVPPGEVGELCIRSGYAMTRYWRNEDATRAAFAGGWLHTGDVARRDGEGFVYLVDRKKDVVISGGQNIYPTEVERVIQTNPAVAEVAVLGLPDPVWGEAVVAVVVRRPETTLSVEDVLGTCREQLAGYKKPTAVHFVDQIPKGVTGKPLKRELRAQLTAD